MATTKRPIPQPQQASLFPDSPASHVTPPDILLLCQNVVELFRCYLEANNRQEKNQHMDSLRESMHALEERYLASDDLATVMEGERFFGTIRNALAAVNIHDQAVCGGLLSNRPKGRSPQRWLVELGIAPTLDAAKTLASRWMRIYAMSQKHPEQFERYLRGSNGAQAAE
jgi:hypothetical protein